MWLIVLFTQRVLRILCFWSRYRARLSLPPPRQYCPSQRKMGKIAHCGGIVSQWKLPRNWLSFLNRNLVLDYGKARRVLTGLVSSPDCAFNPKV
jgi:hypothetical protein